MESVQHQQRYMRPPPAMGDLQQQRPPAPGALQAPPGPPWYPASSQFQYQPSNQWGPPPPSSDHHLHHHQQLHQAPSPPYPPSAPHNQHPLGSAYAAPPLYQAHHPYQHHPYSSPSPIPPPHLPPPPPYSRPNQTWGNPNWPRPQGWEYPDRKAPSSNEEDWGARAKAWAAAKAMENQQSQSQFTPVGRMEEHPCVYHDQYQQAADVRFTDTLKPSLSQTSYQQFPVSASASHRALLDYLQESTHFSSGASSFYATDVSQSYDTRDGALYADSNFIATAQGNIITSTSIYQQEVPSSYSSTAGHGGLGNQNEQLHKPLASTMSSYPEHLNSHTLPSVGGPHSAEQSVFMQGESVEAIAASKDQTSDTDHVHDHDSCQQSSFMHPNQAGSLGGMDHSVAVSSVNAWTSTVAPGVVFPPIPSGPQFDPPFLSPSSIPTPVFGNIPGPSFRPPIPAVGASFGLGAGTTLHPSAAFPGDANGTFNLSERPKKASVPNWLREEIIKNKAALASSSALDHGTEDSFHSLGTEGDDISFRKGDHADSKSIDSSKSAEDDDDDEDEVEAARTAAINQEIKRILTEVLLKVTDELFDEIATKVLSEDDMMVEVRNGSDSVSHKVSPSPPAVPTPKASAKVLIPIKAKMSDVDDATEKSNSSSPGDVLGLANYASDEDEEEIMSSSVCCTKDDDASQEWSNDRKSEDKHKVENMTKKPEDEKPKEALQNSHSICNGEDDMTRKEKISGKELVCDDDGPAADGTGPHERLVNVALEKIVESPQVQATGFDLKDNADGKPPLERESKHTVIISTKSIKVVSQDREIRYKSEKNNEHEVKKSSNNKAKEAEGAIDDNQRREDGQKRNDVGEPKRGEKRSVGKEHLEERGEKGSVGKEHLGERGEKRSAGREHRGERAEKRSVGKEHPEERGVRRSAGKEHLEERHSSLKERIKERRAKPGEHSRESDSIFFSNHANNKEDKKDIERARRGGAKEEGNKHKVRTKDEKEDSSKCRDPRDSHRNKRQRSPPVSRGKNSRDNSLVDDLGGSSDEASDNSRKRKLRSNKRSLSPSPVRSRQRQVSRSPHSRHSQRRHSPYSSLETRRRRSRSGSPVRRR